MTPATNPPTDRELDALLAERVLGWRRPGSYAYAEACAREPKLLSYDGFWAFPDLSGVAASVPEYMRDVSESIGALRDYCRAHDLSWSLGEPAPTSEARDCICSIEARNASDERSATAFAPTLPRAIVLALLRSAGVEVPDA